MTEIVEGLPSAQASATSSRTLCWGLFDGVHRGHQKLIQNTNDLAAELQTPSTILVFEEHPKKTLGKTAPPSIMPLEQRLHYIQQNNPDEIVLVPFTMDLARYSPEEFYREILLNQLSVVGIYAGHDTRFGKGREGDFQTLQELSGEEVEVRKCPALYHNGKPISSTRIRSAIQENRLNEAREMLGRPMRISGTVIRGEGRGKQIGFPTANLELHHDLIPPIGIYGASARIPEQNLRKDSVIGIGRRPTYDTSNTIVVEAHLLNFEGDLYGQTIHLDLETYIRDEKEFETEEELIRAIEGDIEDYQTYLSDQK